MCQTIINAVEQFEKDYDRLPFPTTVLPSKDFDANTSSAAGFVAVLKGISRLSNPREVDYLGDIKDAKTVNDRPLNGLFRDSPTTVGLFDPWGRPYHVRFDGDGDGYVENPSAAGNKIKALAVIWSAGKDGDSATWDDNVASVQLTER